MYSVYGSRIGHIISSSFSASVMYNCVQLLIYVYVIHKLQIKLQIVHHGFMWSLRNFNISYFCVKDLGHILCNQFRHKASQNLEVLYTK